MGMPNLNPASAQELLAQADFVRALSRALLADPGSADDVSQETLLAGVQHPPAAGALRTWLYRVTKNFAMQRARADARRAARERRAARDESGPSPREVEQREAIRASVVRAVLTLEEPYRSVILLRFYDDVAPSEIARRRQVSVETVKTQLRRGLAQLRQRLDGEHGSRQAWMSVLATGLGSTVVPAGTSVGAFAVLAGVLLIAISIPLFFAHSDPLEPTGGLPLPQIVAQQPQLPASDAGSGTSARVAAAQSKRGGVAPPASRGNEKSSDTPYNPPVLSRTDFAKFAIVGRVIDRAGRPVPHTWVAAAREEYGSIQQRDGSDSTDEDGYFCIDSLLNEHHSIIVKHPRGGVGVPIGVRRNVVPRCRIPAGAAGARGRALLDLLGLSPRDVCEITVTGEALDQKAWIRGSIEIPPTGDWKPASVALFTATDRIGTLTTHPESVAGDFEIGPIPPGSYRLEVEIRRSGARGDDACRIDEIAVAVAAEERVDVGIVRPKKIDRRIAISATFRGSSVPMRQIEFRSPKGAASSQSYPATWPESERLGPWIHAFSAFDADVTLFCDGFVPVRRRLRSPAPMDVEQLVVEMAERGLPVKFAPRVPRSGEMRFCDFELHVRAEDPNGFSYMRSSRMGLESEVELFLAPGRYRACVTTEIGARAEAVFEVTSKGGPERIELIAQ